MQGLHWNVAGFRMGEVAGNCQDSCWSKMLELCMDSALFPAWHFEISTTLLTQGSCWEAGNMMEMYMDDV